MFQRACPLRGTTTFFGPKTPVRVVSTRTPLARRDQKAALLAVRDEAVSTRAPLARRDLALQHNAHTTMVSTRAPLLLEQFFDVRFKGRWEGGPGAAEAGVRGVHWADPGGPWGEGW